MGGDVGVVYPTPTRSGLHMLRSSHSILTIKVLASSWLAMVQPPAEPATAKELEENSLAAMT